MKRKYLSPQIEEVDIAKGADNCLDGDCAGGPSCSVGTLVGSPTPNCQPGGSACWCSTGTAEALIP